MKVLRVVLLPVLCAISLLAAACTPSPTGGGNGGNITPIAVASASPDSGAAPLLVRFSPAGSRDADGFIEEYSWNFGDGSPTSSAPDPSHTYSRGGVFTATLTVTDDGGRTASAATVVVVTPPENLPPVANITASTLSGKTPLTVSFGSTGSTDPDGVIASYAWSFGDGDVATTASATHTFLVPGSYVVTLQVTDNDGAVNTDSTVVAVANNLPPVASAVATPSVGKAPFTASFDGGASSDDDGNVVSYSWDFTDGSSATGEVAVHTFTAVGTYDVELTVTDDDGATDTSTVTVQVNAPQPPVAVANATPDGTKAPLGVVFSSAGSTDNDGSIIGYRWDFKDGSPASTSANPSHLYTAPGTYNVTLTVTDDDFLTTTATVPVIVGQPNVPPVAAGTATPAVGKPVLNVQFSAATSSDSDGTVESYRWDFGDGSATSTDPSPTHSYGTLGNYSVLLTVTDNDGAINTVAIPVSVIPNVAPTAQPVATPRTGKEPLSVALSAATSGDSDGRIESYAWDYTSDGTVDSTAVETSHDYIDPGVYVASLTVTDEDGATDTSTVTITVNANQPPTAVANSNFQSGNAPLSVVFEGRDSLDAELDGTITYDWDFGDGTAHSTSPNPTHVFQEIGTYTVTLTVTDDNGATGTDTLTIDALDPVVRVRPTGSDTTGNGTVGAPYATIQGAITGAVAQGKTIVKVAGGSYAGFTAASGVSVVGGFDQSFVAGGSDGASAVTVTAGAGSPAMTASGLAAPLTVKNLTLVGGGGTNATAALVIGSNVTFDGVTADSGVASGVGSSAYGIRAIDGSTVTVTRSSVRARSGVAGAAGAAGTAGVAGANGANGSAGNGSGGGAQNVATPSIRTGGQGANGVKCVLLLIFCVSSLPGNPGGNGGLTDPRGGLPGSGGSSSNGGGGGGKGGTAAAAAAGGAGAVAVPGATFNPGVGGTGGQPLAGPGGGGGGSGGADNNNNSGGGGAGGAGGAVGTGGTGGSGGGGSFAVYSYNSSASIDTTSLTTGTGGAGGNGGAGGAGGAGGRGGNGASGSNSSPGAGGGGAGGGGGNGGGGGAGGIGGPSVGAYHAGTGTQTIDADAAGALASLGAAGAPGAGGAGGLGAAGGAGGNGGANSNAAKAGGAGASGPAGVDGTVGTAGASGVRRVAFDGGVTPNSRPIAAAATSRTSGIAPESVDFSSAGSYDPDGTITYSWNFGDGTAPSTAANPSHTYAAAGTYTATLTVTDNEGATATASTASIVIAANQLPTAVANATPDAGKAPLGVVLSSVGTADADGTVVAYSWNFGDGTATSSAANPSHTYTAQGTYTATLTVTDNKGGTGSATVTVTVSPNNVAPSVSISATPTFGKAPVDVAFTSTVSDSDGTVDSIVWDFGDGSATSTSPNPTHTYAAGVWTATLTATDNDGATTTRSVQVRSLPNLAPTASAAATPSNGRAPLNVQLSSAGSIDFDGTISSYSWNFGDGSASSSAANPTHVYGPGTFTATLTVTDNEGATATATVSISSTVNQAPTAVANAVRNGTKAPLAVDFSSAGSVDNDGTIASFRWTFGDGSAASTLANPSHTYATQGTYAATLTVTDNEGATDVKSVTINVGPPNVAPVPQVAATPTSGRAPLAVSFDSAGSSDADGTIVSYSWDFGDGSPAATTATASHTYGPGTFTATLTVTDDNGTSASKAVTISSTVNVAPTAAASGTPRNGIAPLAVSFSSAGSTDPDGSIVSYAWNFGDGTSSTSASPSHTYAAGDYVATLTVTDNEGGIGTATVAVHANSRPTAVASANVTSGDAPLAVSFTGDASSDADGTIASYRWNFGDGSPVSTSANPTHTYGPGVWTATLTVTDNEGATSTATVTVDVNDPPTASVTSNVTSGTAPLTVAFTGDANDNDGTFSFAWDFGDGSPAVTNDLTPSHTFTAPGSYNVTLTVTDDRGSVTVSAVRTITVS